MSKVELIWQETALRNRLIGILSLEIVAIKYLDVDISTRTKIRSRVNHIVQIHFYHLAFLIQVWHISPIGKYDNCILRWASAVIQIKL